MSLVYTDTTYFLAPVRDLRNIHDSQSKKNRKRDRLTNNVYIETVEISHVIHLVHHRILQRIHIPEIYWTISNPFPDMFDDSGHTKIIDIVR